MKFRSFFISLAIIAMQFFGISVSIAGAPQVILDTLLTGDVPVLNAKDLNIPTNLEPGFHQLEVQVYDDNGVISTQTALFCKDLEGVLHFDNQCPDLTAIQSNKTNIPFDPNKNPEKTITFFAIAAAAFSTIFGLRRSEKNEASNQLELPPDPPNLNAGELNQVDIRKGWGDRRWYINLRIMTSFDDLPKRFSLFFGKKFNLLGRIIIDARYLRAIFGNLSWLITLTSIFLTYLGLQEINNEAIPMGLTITTLLILIGILNPASGLVSGLIYVNFVFANGNIISINSLLFVIFYILLFYAPGLLISKVRKLHRTINDYDSIWSRVCDYFVGAILVGWTAKNIISFLPSMYGFELPLTRSAVQIGVLSGLTVVLRLLLEDIAWYLYPYRLKKLQVELPKNGYLQKLRGILIRTGLFLLVVLPYVGWNQYLAAGLALILIPQFIALASHKIKKFDFFRFILPEGVLRLVLLAIVGLLLQKYALPLIKSSQSTLLTSFVVMMTPGFVFSMLDLFSSKRKILVNKVWLRIFHILGAFIILSLLLLIVSNVDLVKEFLTFTNNPSQSWNTWVQGFPNWVDLQWSTFNNWLLKLNF